ncbi:MAG TPA: response regulator [Candidatus Sulfopaludibacter sp.]|jgi:CheY-like chemotaxis protein|nr:response regulator [Candidatus Sulfopaludibacter sp.]
MSRVLLVDDSPHAQRMGERILSDEGYEVVTVSNADSALVRLEDVDPDVVLADTVMPGRTGYDICQYIKMSPRLKHVRVILTAGVLEPFDEAQLERASADSTLKKPFEASALLAAIKPLAEQSAKLRAENAGGPAGSASARKADAPVAPFIAVVDAEQVRAAVTIALDAAMDNMVDEITRHVLAALNTDKAHAGEVAAAPPLATPHAPPHAPPAAVSVPVAAAPKAPASFSSRISPVRRVSPLRPRSGSILGLDISRPEPPADEPDADSE